jgi:PhnB protein
MMRVDAHLSFNGQCREAFEYYERHIGGKVTMMMTWGDSPMAAQAPSDQRDKVMHASLSLGESTLIGADAPPGHYKQPQGFAATLNIDQPAQADRIFGALAEQGVVQMPIQETFWALRFGMLIDRFGTPWMVNCGKP